MTPKRPPAKPLNNGTTAAIAFCLLIAVLLRTAWVSDQSYLTFRTVDNFIHGYGLRWNPLERVQAFSHPLWLLLIAAGYRATGEPYYTVLFLSAVMTIAAVLVLIVQIARGEAAAIGATAILILSRTFVDYSTSGLEHPLVHLLLVLFYALYFAHESDARQAGLAWIAGLLAVTRLDSILLVAPALFLVLRRQPRPISRRVYAALLPLIAWEIFATIYYGFPLPNAAYAWASAAAGPSTLLRHGAIYLLDSINLDPITMATIVSAVALAFTGRLPEGQPIALGVILSVAFTFAIGGDAMSGRLLAAPLLCAVIAIGRFDLSAVSGLVRAQALALIVFAGLMAPRYPLVDGGDPFPAESEATGIVDARRMNFPATGLFNVILKKIVPNAFAAERGKAARDAHREVVPSGGNLVPAAFYAGPSVHIIDRTGDADPLLSRVPPEDFALANAPLRAVPDGYEESVVTGVNRIADPVLASLYDRLLLITRGPLWSGERWRAILGFTPAAGARRRELSNR